MVKGEEFRALRGKFEEDGLTLDDLLQCDVQLNKVINEIYLCFYEAIPCHM